MGKEACISNCCMSRGVCHRLSHHAVTHAMLCRAVPWPLCALQDRIHEHAQEFLDLMASDDCIFYFCGLKRMYTSVLDMLEVRAGGAWPGLAWPWAMRGRTGVSVCGVECEAAAGLCTIMMPGLCCRHNAGAVQCTCAVMYCSRVCAWCQFSGFHFCHTLCR